MQPCNKCLENNWRFEKLPDHFIKATCQSCGESKEWEGKKREIWDHGSKCPTCHKPLVSETKPPSKRKLKRPYYFSTLFKCLKCQKVFHNEKYKVHKDI